MTIQIRRIYEPPSKEDGSRFLVDRLWPRGISKDKADLSAWLKELAPSNELRVQFHRASDGPDEAWEEFQQAYANELDKGGDDVNADLEQLKAALALGRVTLLYGARNEQRNNAVALLHWLNGHNIG